MLEFRIVKFGVENERHATIKTKAYFGHGGRKQLKFGETANVCIDLLPNGDDEFEGDLNVGDK